MPRAQKHAPGSQKGASTGAPKHAPGSQKGAPTGPLKWGTFLCPDRGTFDSQCPWTSTKQKNHEPRFEDEIIVGRDFNSKGGVKVFLLGSNQIVPRDSYTTAVNTDAVISQINSFSAQQPISGELFPDTHPTDAVPLSDAISKTTLSLPGVSPLANHEHEIDL